MIIDVPHRPTKHNSETQQTLPLDSSSPQTELNNELKRNPGIELNVSHHSTRVEFQSTALNIPKELPNELYNRLSTATRTGSNLVPTTTDMRNGNETTMNNVQSPTFRRTMKPRPRSLNNERIDSQESSQTLPPSRSIDVYPFELNNGTTTHIIHAEQQYADKALEQPLLIPKPTPQIPHCFVIFHSNKKTNPPKARSSNSSQYSEQQEQQLDEVLEQPHLRGKQQSVHQEPSTSKVRTYVSQPRNSRSIFIDRVNSFGDIIDHPRSPDPQHSNDRQSRYSKESSELGVERELRTKRQRRVQPTCAIPMPNFDQTTQGQPQLEQERTPDQEAYCSSSGREATVQSDSQEPDEAEVERRLQALPAALQFASKGRLVQELAAIQVESKGLNCQQRSLNWHQRQTKRRSQEIQTSQSEPLNTFGKAFASTSKNPNFTNFWIEFQKLHQAMTRLLRSLNHQSKETQEAIQALESWINSSDHLRSAETELLDRDIAIRTKLNLFNQMERIRISPTPQLDNLQQNEEPTPQCRVHRRLLNSGSLDDPNSPEEPDTLLDTPSVQIQRKIKTSRELPRRTPNFASDQTASVFRGIPTQTSTKTPKSRHELESSSKFTRPKPNVSRMGSPTREDQV